MPEDLADRIEAYRRHVLDAGLAARLREKVFGR
jgi:hypothetical protein